MAEDFFDPSKEGRRVVMKFGQPNERQITEDKQRAEEAEARAQNAKMATEKENS